MELWIRSQNKENLLKSRFLTIIEGKPFYDKDEGYTICNVALNGHYELLGTYKTKERSIEVLDEIQNILKPTIITTGYECELKENIKDKTSFNLDIIPTKTEIQELSTVVYQMPKD